MKEREIMERHFLVRIYQNKKSRIIHYDTLVEILGLAGAKLAIRRAKDNQTGKYTKKYRSGFKIDFYSI